METGGKISQASEPILMVLLPFPEIWLKSRSTSSAHCVLYRGKSFSLFHFIRFYSIVVQFLTCVSLFETSWAAACEASLPFTISWNLLKLMSIESMMPSNCLILFPLSPLVLNLAWGQGLFHWVGTSASASVLPGNIQGWFPLEWIGWISLQSKGLSRFFSNTPFKSINSLALSLLYGPTPILLCKYPECVLAIGMLCHLGKPGGQQVEVTSEEDAASPPTQPGPLFHEDKFPLHRVESRLWLTTVNDLESMKAFMLTLPSQYAASGQGSGPHSLNGTG